MRLPGFIVILASAGLPVSAASDASEDALAAIDREIAFRLGSMQLTLRDAPMHKFVLTYTDQRRLAYKGEVCYAFAGYNETCLAPKIAWLNAGTQIELHAPGGVPMEFLRNYIVLVRFPKLSEATFRYEVAKP